MNAGYISTKIEPGATIFQGSSAWVILARQVADLQYEVYYSVFMNAMRDYRIEDRMFYYIPIE